MEEIAQNPLVKRTVDHKEEVAIMITMKENFLKTQTTGSPLSKEELLAPRSNVPVQ